MVARRSITGHWWLAFLVAVLGLAAWSTSAADSTSSGAPSDVKALADKYLVLSVTHTLEKSRSFCLTEVRQESLGDRTYLVGKWFTPDGVRPKITYWVAVNQIDMMAVYDNLDDVKKQYEEQQEQK